jgi:tRNA A-37 threonylcarbamoyl transferase component Bud32
VGEAIGVTDAPAARPLGRGDEVGRYTILARVGDGDAGEVVTAFDPELNRKIALKLLRTTEGGEEGAGARLLREARALARLSHPNVVRVHDAGAFGTRVFVAMELVEGVTLDEWLARGRRTRAEILQVFCAAGRGLAAAHAADLVHRGFEPRNVMVSRGGAVRVMDFGLEAKAGVGPGVELIDARADQVAFCTALERALQGDVPGWVRRVLQRGQAAAPDERWPSMDALVTALERDPARARRRAGVVAGVGVLVALAGVQLVRGAARAPSLCRGGAARVAGAWEPASAAHPRRDAIHDAFARSGAATATAVWERVAPALDRYAARWVAMYGEACEATHVRHDQSAAVLDLRMRCLDERRTALVALTDVLARADRGVVTSAVDAVNALPSLDRCADLKLLQAPVEPPRDEETRRRVEDVRQRAAVAKAVNDTGQHEEAIRLTRALVAEARVIGYAPLLAEMLDANTTAHSGPNFRPEVISLQEEEIWIALASGRDDLAATAAIALVSTVGAYAARYEESRRWQAVAEAILGRLGAGNDLLWSWLYMNEGVVRLHETDFAGALELARRAAALKRKVLPPGHPDIANSMNSEAEALASLGHLDEALRINERILAIFSTAYGPAATEVAYTLSNRGEYLVGLGRAGEALAPLREALAAWQAQIGPDHQFLAFPLTATGRALLALRRAAEAVPPLERAVKLREAREPDQLLVAESRFALAQALAAAGNPAGDRTRAHTLAVAARDAYDRAGAAKQRATVEAWLAVY